MKTETMTIHEALSELKMLDARISKYLLGMTFAVSNKHSNQKIGGQTIDEFVDSANNAFKSMMDMAARRKAIRNALSQSNAVTKVVVGGVDYTMAEVIEMRKSGMDNYRRILNQMNDQLVAAKRAIEREKERLDEKADQYVAGLIGGKDKANSAEAITLRKAYIDANSVDLVAMKNIDEEIRKMSDFIDAFESEVDSKISISNALTTITIEY